MPGASYTQINALCPFYRSDDGRTKIICEGITDESTILFSFARKNSMRAYLDQHCCSSYKQCPIYKKVYETKYEED